MSRNAWTRRRMLTILLVLIGSGLMGTQCPGLSIRGFIELHHSGVNNYLGDFTPVATSDVGDGWTRHDFDPDGGNGPVCIAGSPYAVFTREGNPHKLLIVEQGGGACWQDFYNCNVVLEDNFLPPAPPVGIWDFNNPDNPFADYSILYMPYCDGSVFTGDNDVVDPAWQAFIEAEAGLPPGSGPPIRFHRGLRNQSAGMDVAKATFPHAYKITTAGSSAGGVGIAGFAPFLVRFLYGNLISLTAFNDAGPITVNLDQTEDIAARAADWDFGKFYPASCTECDVLGQAGTEIVKWRLGEDKTIREAFYETDQDFTNRFFLGLLFDPAGFRDLVVTEHGLINDEFPNRYKRFIVADDSTHTALQTPLFYTQDADGILLNEWTSDFLKGKPGWVDVVEEPAP